MFKKNSILIITSIFSLFFFTLIAFDFSPLLRGPAPYPPDWRWPYEPANTLSRIWLPLFTTGIIILNFWRKEKKFENTSNYRVLILFVVLSFVLQISLLYYSRSGVEVLVHRTINPMISGYFTVSTQISNLASFITNFNQSLHDYPMYTRFHPPGGILLYYLFEFFLRPFTHLFSSLLTVSPSHADVATIWNDLSYSQRLNALGSGLMIAFLAGLAIIPTYFSTKLLYGEKAAFRSVALFTFAPSVLLFTPLIDVFMPLFTSISLYLVLKGFKEKGYLYFFLSGLVLFAGVFFTLTFLPIMLFLFLIFVFRYFQQKEDFTHIIKNLFSLMLGVMVIPFILFFAGLNLIEMTKTIMLYHEAAQAGREHLIWFFYNLYDFFLFAGIPIGILFIYLIFKEFRMFKIKNIKRIEIISVSFLIMLLVVNFSGAVRAETARIWLPFIPILIIVIANFTTNKLKFTNRQFILLLLLQATQVIVFQTFLVAVW